MIGRLCESVRLVEHQAYRHRMKILGLIGSIALGAAVFMGHADAGIAFGLIGGVFFRWIDGRGQKRIYDEVASLLTAARGGGLVPPELGPAVGDLFKKFGEK